MRIIYGEDIGKEIPDEQVVFYDGFVDIIHGGQEYKQILLDGEYDAPISLASISLLYPDVEKVIFEDMLNGWIYSYGNHRPGEWELVGETCGYA